MNQLLKYLKLWLPVILWAGMIFYFSSQQRISSGLEEISSGIELDLIFRKAVHVFEYFMLTCLLYRAINGSFVLPKNKVFFHALMIALIYALLDEFHQSFVPTRTGSLYDVMVDSIGIVLAYFILRCKHGKLCQEFESPKG